MLEKDEKKTIEDFLSLIEDLEQPEKDLVIESSNKTIESCEFTTDKVNVFAGYEEDNLSFEVFLSEVGGLQARCDEDCLAGKDKDEELQQKEIKNSLLSDEVNTDEDDAIMIPIIKPDINEDKEDLNYLHGQEKMVGQTSRIFAVMKDQNFIHILF